MRGLPALSVSLVRIRPMQEERCHMFELIRLRSLTIARAFTISLAFVAPPISPAALPAVPATAISLRIRNRTTITNPTTITRTFTISLAFIAPPISPAALAIIPAAPV